MPRKRLMEKLKFELSLPLRRKLPPVKTQVRDRKKSFCPVRAEDE